MRYAQRATKDKARQGTQQAGKAHSRQARRTVDRQGAQQAGKAHSRQARRTAGRGKSRCLKWLFEPEGILFCVGTSYFKVLKSVPRPQAINP